jgi:hypothetical protein
LPSTLFRPETGRASIEIHHSPVSLVHSFREAIPVEDEHNASLNILSVNIDKVLSRIKTSGRMKNNNTSDDISTRISFHDPIAEVENVFFKRTG